MTFLFGSGGLDSGWGFLAWLALTSVIVLFGYVISGAAGLAGKKKPAPPPPKGRAVFLGVVTLFLGVVLIREILFPENRDDLGTFLIVLLAPIVVAFCMIFVFKGKKTRSQTPAVTGKERL